MIVLEGLPALSPFRRDRLETSLRVQHDGIRIAGAWWIYFIDSDPGATPDRAALERILQAHRRNGSGRARREQPVRRAATGHAFAMGEQGHRDPARRRPAGASRRARHAARCRRTSRPGLAAVAGAVACAARSDDAVAAARPRRCRTPVRHAAARCARTHRPGGPGCGQHRPRPGACPPTRSIT